MRMLVLGAGAVGGYFGARLLKVGRDVTFLVRPQRAAKLRRGLVVRSPAGDIKVDEVPTITAEELTQPFDLVLLTCKAYDLESAMNAVAPAVGPTTSILPLLNGMSHIDALNARFGKQRVLGGWCAIASTVNEAGEILHLHPLHALSFGEQDGGKSQRLDSVRSALSGATFNLQAADSIVSEMWEKWIYIASAAGITCLMRGAVGDIVAADAADLCSELLNECAGIAKENGVAPRQATIDRYRSMLSDPNSLLTASMLRDLEAGAPVEADHILGDLLRRGSAGAQSLSLLRIAYAHLKTYEQRRLRERRASSPPA